jgi:competence protein ComEC
VLHREIPFIRLLVPLCAGILTGYLSEIDIIFFKILLLVACATLLASLPGRTLVSNKLFGAATSLILIAAGFILVRLELSIPEELDNYETTYLCRVKSFPEPKPKSYAVSTSLTLKVSAGGITEKVRGGLLIYHSPSDTVAPHLTPGDIIAVTVSPLPFSNRGNPFEFDYQRHMLKKGIRYYAFTNDNSLAILDSTPDRALRERALITGKRIAELYEKNLKGKPNAALLSALTLGQKEMLDEDMKEDFARAGVMHVMAVSGLHAGVISMFVFGLLFFLKGRALVIRVLISVAVLWGFAFITGLPPSVVRASLMFTFLHFGKLLKRPVNSLNSILASAFLMLVVNPSDLTSLSFQLSYSAVLFISGFFWKASQLIRPGIFPLKWLWQMAVVSILAQLGTLPFTLNAFGRFPVWFLPANIIIIPLASLIIITAFLMILSSPVPAVSSLLGGLLNHLTGLAIESAGFIARLPGFHKANLVMPMPESLALLLFIWASLYILLVKREKSLLLPVLTILPLIIISTIRHIHTELTSEVIVYNCPGTAVGIREGHNLLVIADSAAGGQAVSRHAESLSLNVRHHQLSEIPLKIAFHEKVIIISEKNNRGPFTNEVPDILIVRNKPRLHEIDSVPHRTEIVVTSGRTGVIIPTEINDSDSERHIHFVQEDGALVLKFPGYSSKREKKID